MVRFVSTRGEGRPVSFTEAMQKGLASDGGLYLPDPVPYLPDSFWKQLKSVTTFTDVCKEIAAPYLYTDQISEEENHTLLKEIVENTITFDAPVVPLKEQLYVLELFHGPTLAFKDFGARFMARAFAHFDTESSDGRDLLVLVATSGDTGSAVAHGFYGVKGTQVCLLYPSGKVSELQEKQMTTLGGNVHALEINGTFDQCQALVKEAFADRKLRKQLRLSSANSINVARLLPQSFYYVHALGQLQQLLKREIKPVFSVPSGNFGNLTAGLIAKKMGMPASKFIAATNRNDVVPEYLDSGQFEPRKSVQTISNAMDVGAPSNFERILHLFNNSHGEIKKMIWGAAFNDEQTRKCIRETYRESGYIADPHTAVGILAAEKFMEEGMNKTDEPIVILSTAHPAKFKNIVEEEIERTIDVPERLKTCIHKKKKALPLESDYEDFSDYLVSEFGNV